MTTIAAAIYEHGVLRPLSPLPLAEGAPVEVTVTDDAPSAQAMENGRAVDLLREVAALPMESGDASFSGRDHDRVLCGGSGGNVGSAREQTDHSRCNKIHVADFLGSLATAGLPQ